jgi:hypothetical protein
MRARVWRSNRSWPSSKQPCKDGDVTGSEGLQLWDSRKA